MRLFAFNRNVDAFNESKLASLPSPPVVFNAEDSGRLSTRVPHRVSRRHAAALPQLQRALPAASEVWRAGDAVEEPRRGARAGERLARGGDVLPPLAGWCGGVAGGAMGGWGVGNLPCVRTRGVRRGEWRRGDCESSPAAVASGRGERAVRARRGE